MHCFRSPPVDLSLIPLISEADESQSRADADGDISDDEGDPSAVTSNKSLLHIITRSSINFYNSIFAACVGALLVCVVYIIYGITSKDHLATSRAITRVGVRQFTPRYYTSSSCTSAQFLSSLSRARISQSGRSRTVNLSYVEEPTSSLSLPPFEYSFALDGCGQPHVFDQAEACDLVEAFGGIFMKGDSLVRHVHYALMMLLRDSADAALVDGKRHLKGCHYEAMFFDHTRVCHFYYQRDSQNTKEPVCNGNVHLYHSRVLSEEEHGMTNYAEYIAKLPPHITTKSPIFLQSLGLHFDCSIPPVLRYLHSAISYFSTLYIPRPIHLWIGLHAPGLNKPAQHNATQGREMVQILNTAVRDEIERISPEGSMIYGATNWMGFYNITDGAQSWDGTHYSYQVNMEKAQILLNLLDIVWGETVAQGGLVSLPDPVPIGPSNATAGEIADEPGRL